MQLVDSNHLRDLLCRLLPGLVIEQAAKPSGQRIVYFCTFEGGGAKGKQIAWGKIVLKVAAELHPTQIAYLQKEIEILNSLESPNYPKLYYNDVFSEDPGTETRLAKRLFITIEERVDAQPLTICRNKFFDERSVLELLLKLVDALSLIWNHKKKLVHRDLKPDNILIKENNDVVIIDLGILREEGAVGLTKSYAFCGPCTPLYASPEQARNDKKNISFKSDLFSLGTIAYELMTGSNPYVSGPDDGVAEILENVVNMTPPSLKSLNKASDRFSNLLEKLMAKEPYQRHRSVEFLKADLQSIKEGLV